MRKDTFKNITLVILILISVFLFSNMWFSEKLWSKGYDFFAFFDVFSSNNDENSATFAIEDIITPRRFVINGTDKRSIITDSSTGYSRCRNDVFAAFKTAEGNFSSSTTEEWKSTLKSKSILVDFSTPVSAGLLADAGIPAPETGLFSKIIIAPFPGNSSYCSAYFENTTGEILKCFTENQPLISALISTHTEGSGAINIPYAFELGFDSVKFDENKEITQNILLDSTISLGLAENKISSAIINNAIGAENTDKITKNFFDAGVSVKRYVEKDGSIVFVNRKSTLKISYDGYIEYTAEGEGKKITNIRCSDAEAVASVMSLVRSISAHYNLSDIKFQLQESPVFDENGVTSVSFDYLLQSYPVIIKNNKGENVPAVTAKIKNGRLIYFKLYVCNASSTDKQTVLPSMLKAIDSLYSKADGEKLDVSDLYISYITDETLQTAKPYWCAKIKNSDRIIIIDGE